MKFCIHSQSLRVFFFLSIIVFISAKAQSISNQFCANQTKRACLNQLRSRQSRKKNSDIRCYCVSGWVLLRMYSVVFISILPLFFISWITRLECVSVCVCVHFFRSIWINTLKRDEARAFACKMDETAGSLFVPLSVFFSIRICIFFCSLCSVAWEQCLSGNRLFEHCVDRSVISWSSNSDRCVSVVPIQK